MYKKIFTNLFLFIFVSVSISGCGFNVLQKMDTPDTPEMNQPINENINEQQQKKMVSQTQLKAPNIDKGSSQQVMVKDGLSSDTPKKTTSTQKLSPVVQPAMSAEKKIQSSVKPDINKKIKSKLIDATAKTEKQPQKLKKIKVKQKNVTFVKKKRQPIKPLMVKKPIVFEPKAMVNAIKVQEKIVKPIQAQTGVLSGEVTMVNQAGKLMNNEYIIIVLNPLNQTFTPTTQSMSEIEMKNKTYLPAYSIIQKGDKVIFNNYDKFKHNVFSLSANNKFDLGTYASGKRPEVTFENNGIVKVYCNIHPSMASFVMVTDSPYHRVIKSGETYYFNQLKPGQYQLTAWNIRGNYQTRLTLNPLQNSQDIKIEVVTNKFKPHLNKYNKKYPIRSGDDEYF